MIEQIIIPSKRRRMKTNVARTSKGDTLEMEDTKGKTEKKLDMDKENNKKNMMIDGRKNAETGMNTFDNPCHTSVESGKISWSGNKKIGLGCTGM